MKGVKNLNFCKKDLFFNKFEQIFNIWLLDYLFNIEYFFIINRLFFGIVKYYRKRL